MYVHVSSDGSYLTQPIKGIIRADLVSATVSRTVPTVQQGEYLKVGTDIIHVPQGFYDQGTLINYLNSWAISGVSIYREPNTFFTRINVRGAEDFTGTSNVLSVLGFIPGKEYKTAYDDRYYLRSDGPGISPPTQIFLDIEELRHPYMNGYFATFPFDTPVGGIKVFNESSDLQCTVVYPKPLDTIHRLTPRWFDQYRNPLQISGDFLLRLYCKDD
jgi:hypothetical protein